MKVSKFFSSLLTNKFVLYLVAAVALLNVFGYMTMGNINAVVFFILVGYIVTFFSKNMIIVLLCAMIFTNLLVVGMQVKEGFESSSKEQDKNKKTENDAPIIIPYHDDVVDEAKNDESFKTRDEPLEYTNIDSTIKKKGKDSGTRLDHSATVENAYDTLNKIIGGPGFAKMTEDTKRLMEQQQKLAKSMEQFGPMLDSIQPFLEKAQGLLGNIDVNGISDMINKTKIQSS